MKAEWENCLRDGRYKAELCLRVQGPGGRLWGLCVYWGDSPCPWPLPRCVCVCIGGTCPILGLCPGVCVCVWLCLSLCVGVLGELAPSLAFAQGLHTCSHSLSDTKCDRQPPVEQASPDIPLAGPGPAAAQERKSFPDLSSPLAGPG